MKPGFCLPPLFLSLKFFLAAPLISRAEMLIEKLLINFMWPYMVIYRKEHTLIGAFSIHKWYLGSISI